VMIVLTRVLDAQAPRSQFTVSQFVFHHIATAHAEFSCTADLRAACADAVEFTAD
jgi:hypothetical protein